MIIREALLTDIPPMHTVRVAVRENRLSDPNRIRNEDYVEYMTRRGRGWICQAGDALVGFAIADLQDHSIWALFVHPEWEEKGIGGALHDAMLDWYFSQTDHEIWLTTAPHTRAERFYVLRGWNKDGPLVHGEQRLTQTRGQWLDHRALHPLRPS